MVEISRREALNVLGISSIASLGLPGCCFIREIINVPCDNSENSNNLQEWRKLSIEWWKERKKEREKERQIAIAEEKRADVETPVPYLIPDKEGRSGIISQFNLNCRLNKWIDLFVRITNDGNAPSWNCIVETYETPFDSIQRRYTEETLNDRTIITLMPGETKNVKMKFRPTRATNGRFVLRCYDPIKDPDKQIEEYGNRHNNGFFWKNLDLCTDGVPY